MVLSGPWHLERGDCQHWAFGRIGLPQYRWKTRESLSPLLRDGNIPELEPTNKLEERVLVTYSKTTDPVYLHFGVGFLLGEELLVESRFGPDGLLLGHRLEAVPLIYGDNVDFYRLRNS